MILVGEENLNDVIDRYSTGTEETMCLKVGIE